MTTSVSLLNIVSNYHIETAVNKKWITFDKKTQSWSLTSNKSKAANLDEIFHGLAKEVSANYETLKPSDLSHIKKNAKEIKDKYDRSAGIYRITFGLMNQYKSGLSYRFLNNTIDILNNNTSNSKYSVEKLRGKVRLINKNSNFDISKGSNPSNRVELLFVHHPNLIELSISNDTSPEMLVNSTKNFKNFPSLEWINLPKDMKKEDVAKYLKIVPLIKKSCKNFQGFSQNNKLLKG